MDDALAVFGAEVAAREAQTTLADAVNASDQTSGDAADVHQHVFVVGETAASADAVDVHQQVFVVGETTDTTEQTGGWF